VVLARTTVRDALDSALIALTAAGCETPRLDAEVLLAAAMGVDRAALIADPGRGLEPAAARAFQDAARRRTQREPVAYILGRKGFRRIELEVDPRVLIPRPETEHVVEAALGLPRGARVVDVGTGSGAIALALADERPDLRVVATDASADALAVARSNAARLGLEVEFVEGDLLDAVSGPVDAVVSNPPYVRAGETLPPEIARYEPAGALFAGPDGLDVLRRLVPAAAAAGASFAAFEVGAGQAGDVAALLRGAGFTSVDTIRDLAGTERVVRGSDPPASRGAVRGSDPFRFAAW
jgi:release factor glutamine methyltransferase